MVLSFRPTRRKMFRAMILPAILPDIMTAWKVNLGNASRVVVVAELVGATGGVGYELLMQQQQFDMAGALAWTLQLVLFVLIVAADHRADRSLRLPLPRRVGAMPCERGRGDAGNPPRSCVEDLRTRRQRRSVPRGRRPQPCDRAGRARRHPGQDRLRQVDDLQHDRRARRAERRPACWCRATIRSASSMRCAARSRSCSRATGCCRGAPRSAMSSSASTCSTCRARSAARSRSSGSTRLGLAGHEHDYPHALSGGMRQRVVDRARVCDRCADSAVRRAVLGARRDHGATAARGVRHAGAPEPQDRRVHHPFHQRSTAGRRSHRGAAAPGPHCLRRADYARAGADEQNAIRKRIEEIFAE